MELSPEDKLPLSVIKIHPTAKDLNAIDHLIPQIKDWDKVQSLLIQHGSAPLFFVKLPNLKNRHYLPEKVQKALQQAYYHTLSRNMLLFNTLKEVAEVLKKEQIMVVALKGSYLAATLYGDLAIRQLSDIDILVPKHQGEKAVELLERLGFTSFDESVSGFIASQTEIIHYPPLVRNGISVEVHIRLHRKSNDYQLITEQFLLNAIPYNFQGIEAYGLQLYDLIIHLCVHIDKHFEGEHIQMKCFNDIANLLITNNDRLDWETFIKTCKIHSAEQIVLRYLLLTAEFYQLELPTRIINSYSHLVGETHRQKFINYLHCEYDKKYHVNTHLHNINHINRWSSKIRYFIELIFPPKEFMFQKYISQLKMKNEKLITKNKTFINRLLIANYKLLITFWWLWYPYRWWVGVKGLVKMIRKELKIGV